MISLTSNLKINAITYYQPHAAHSTRFSAQEKKTDVPMSTYVKDWSLISEKPLLLFKKAFGHPKLWYDFAGDNLGPANPLFLKAQALALSIPHGTYQTKGPLFERMRDNFKTAFTNDPAEPFLVMLAPTGTAANRLGFSPFTRSIDKIIMSDVSHAYTREAGGYHFLNKASAYPLKHNKGKILAAQLKDMLNTFNKAEGKSYSGYSKPRAVSISQPTEYGTYYRADEVKEIAKLCHDNGMLLQMDGSRLFYLPKTLDKSLKKLTTDLGVDIVFLGGSKNGMVMSESIVFTPNFFENSKSLGLTITPENLYNTMRSLSKQSGTLVGQSAAAAAQFSVALENDYLINKVHNATKKAKELEQILTKIPNSALVCPVETNLVLLSLPEKAAKTIKQHYKVMIFPQPDLEQPGNRIVRFMTNYSTTGKQINNFEKFLKEKKIIE